jgi:diguanylate cyclase (GGDEF)-like protein
VSVIDAVTNPDERWWRAPLCRTVILALTVATCAVVAYYLGLRGTHPATNTAWPWWSLAIAFAVAQRLDFHIEIRRQVMSFTLAEVPLVLGLFFASPQQLVIGRVVGEAIALVIVNGQAGRKLMLNVAAFLAETVTASWIFVAIGHRDLDQPIAWLAVVVSIAIGDAITLALVALVIRWHGSPTKTRPIMMTNLFTLVGNSGLAISAALLMQRSLAAAIPLSVLVFMVYAAYRSYNSVVQRYASLEVLYDFTRLVSGSQRPEAVLETMLNDARRILRAEVAAIGLRNDRPTDSADVWFQADTEHSITQIDLQRLIDLTADGNAVVMARNTRDPQLRAILSALGVKDCLIAPVHEGSNVVGVLVAANRENDVTTFGVEDSRMFATIANHASIALENGRLIERLRVQATQREYEALHDPLTGLGNRTLFLADVTKAIELASGRHFGVALLDLNDFKEVNDTLGHHHGDLLLTQVAARLVNRLPAAVSVARLGGDEFALLTPFDASEESLRELGEQVQAAFAEPFLVESLALEVHASVGFALFPDHATDPTTLMQRADVAMYEAKGSGSHRVEVYDAERDLNTPRRLAFATDLRAALEAKEITLYYQPKARMSDGVIQSVEGLARWNHRQHGFISPDEFVMLAERTGLIQLLTHHVLTVGLDQLEQWSQTGLDIGMSINLSMRNLTDRDLPNLVGRLLATSAIDPAKVTFEVTETAMMTEPETTRFIVGELADLGVRISVDDFGTGHSSLGYLSKLRVHELKIDKSFVGPLTVDPQAAVIVRSIIDLARNLGISVVAEGVEDQRTWDALHDLGCEIAQGYYLSRPITPAALESWLRSTRRKQTELIVPASVRTPV